MSTLSSAEREQAAWELRLSEALRAKDQSDHDALRLAFQTLAQAAFEANSPERLNQLISLGWTPWMQSPELFFAPFAKSPRLAEHLFNRHPEYAAWFPLSSFLAQYPAQHGLSRSELSERLNFFADLPCFSRQAFGAPQDGVKTLTSGWGSIQPEAHPRAEAFLGIGAWARASRPETIEFCLSLLKSVNGAKARYGICSAACSAILLSRGHAATSQASSIRELLSHIAEAGQGQSLAHLVNGDDRVRESIQGMPMYSAPTPLNRGQLPSACIAALNSSLAGKALLGPSPQLARDLLDLGAGKPSLGYWREEILDAPKNMLDQLQEGGSKGARALRKIERARAMIPLDLDLKPSERDDLLAALDGQSNAMSDHPRFLRVGSTASFAEIALIALFAHRPSLASPEPNWSLLGPALSSILEPGERLGLAVKNARSALLSGRLAPPALRDEFKSYLEGCEIMEASKQARPEAGAAAPGRFKL